MEGESGLIFKIQVNWTSTSVLAYNKDKSQVIEVNGDAAAKLIKNNNWTPMSKYFYEAEIKKDKLILKKRVRDRSW